MLTTFVPRARRRQRWVPQHALERQPRDVRTAVAAVREVVLWLLAGVGALMFVGTVVLNHAGYRPMVVRSGSMEPAIATGALVITERVDAADIEIGDVVGVPGAGGRGRVIHRVVSVERDGATAILRTKGDANDDVDPSPVTVRAVDRVAHDIGGLGQLGGKLATPGGGFVLGGLLSALVIGGRRRKP